MTQQTPRLHRLSFPRLVVAALLLLTLGVGGRLTQWMIARADREMRADLVQQAQQVAQSVNIERVYALSGTEEDQRSPDYQRLKEQFASVRSINPLCRFIYLLGRNTDGKLFFFVDSEPETSGDYSPPGQIYEEATEVAYRVFAARAGAVEGPVTDRWGKWFSALVPILDPQTVMYGLATPEDARGMVTKAMEFYRKNGREALLKAINNPQGEFRKADLYAFAYDRSMTWLAHPVKPELVGQNWIDEKDWSGGKYFHREIQEVAKTKGNGWVEFEYENPINGQHDHKTAYVQGLDDLIICAGAYKGDGEILAVLGVDVDARIWNARLVRAALPPALLTLALVALLLIGSWLVAKRFHGTVGRVGWMQRVEPVLAAVLGLVLTVFAVWVFHEREARDRKESFLSLAASRTKEITELLRNLQTSQIEGLALFYEHGHLLSMNEFFHYAQYLVKNTAVQAWTWVPAVSAAEKAHFEEDARAAGMKGFEIWQNDVQGKRVPAAGREVYYPVFRVMPRAGNESALGYDIGSEPVCREALEDAMRTGLPTGAAPIVLLQDAGSQKGMLLCRPVFSGDAPKQLSGYALATVRMGALLKGAATDALAPMELSLLSRDAAPKLLVSTWTTEKPPETGFSATRTVCVFGKVFAVTAYEGAEFGRVHPTQAGWLTAGIGLIFTAALVFLTNAILRRREALEELVLERTAALVESEQHLSATLHSIGDGVIACDAEGNVTSLNAVAEMMTGWSTGEARGLAIADIFHIIHSGTRLEAEIPVARALNENRIIELANHTALISRDGLERSIADSCAPIHGEAGEVTGAVLVFRDVTNEYQQREQLQESEALQRLLLTHLPVGVVIIDPQTRIIERVNDYVTTLFGATEDHLLGRKCHSFLCPVNEGECPVCDFGLAVDNAEREMLRADGSRMPILKTVKRIHLHGQDKLLECFVDISERKRAEAALQESEQSYRNQFVNNSAVMLLIEPTDGKIIDANAAALHFYGYPRERLLAMSISDINRIPPSEVLHAMDSVPEGVGMHFEFQHRLADGSVREVEVSSSRIQFGGRLVLHSIIHDISERKRAEWERQQLEIQLRHVQKMESIGRLAAGIAHEINTPIQYVLNNVVFVRDAFSHLNAMHQSYRELLARLDAGTVIEAQVAQLKASEGSANTDFFCSETPVAIEQSMEGIDRVIKIVRAMKDFSHPGTGGPTPTDINQQIASTLTVCRSEWKYVAEVVTDFDPELPLVPCYSSEFNQAILNIVVNAAQAIADVVVGSNDMPPTFGSMERRRVQDGRSKGTITVTTRKDGDWVEVRISDTGPGIPHEVRDSLFDPFFTTKEVGKGSGLGLAIVHSIIVKKHGGTLRLESEPGKGSAFIFRLPLKGCSIMQ